MINRVTLIGHLGKDPEVRTTAGGTVVGHLSLATTESVKQGDGWVDHTEWHRVTLFGRAAENAARFLKKGSKAYVEGRIRSSKYKDKDGIDRYSFEIVCDVLKFLDPNPNARRATPDEAPAGDGRESDRSGTFGASGGFGGADDDIPF